MEKVTPIAWLAFNELTKKETAFTNEQKESLAPHINQLYSKWIPLYTNG